jgi:hypothetical protein
MRSRDPFARVRKICLALPETTEKLAWGEPTWRVAGKMFVMGANNHHDDGRIAIWCNAPLGAQAMLIELDGKRFFRPPYVGGKGWVGIDLGGKADWAEVENVILQAYRTTAPKRLLLHR